MQGASYIKTASQRALQTTWEQDMQEDNSVCNRKMAQSRQASWRRQHLKALQEHMQDSPIP